MKLCEQFERPRITIYDRSELETPLVFTSTGSNGIPA